MVFEKFIEVAVREGVKEALSPNEKLIVEGENAFEITKIGMNKPESYVEMLRESKENEIKIAKAYFLDVGDIEKAEALDGANEVKKIETLREAREKAGELFKETNSENLFDKFIKTESLYIKESVNPEIIGSGELDFFDIFEEFTDDKYYSVNGYVGPNCMAYAYGIPCDLDGTVFDCKPFPGYFSGSDMFPCLYTLEFGTPEEIKSFFEENMKKDLEVLGKEIFEVNSNDYVPKDGERMIALVTSSDIAGMGPDFHYYVKDKNGYWSHKPGVTNPTIFDNMGNIIKDPLNCDRGYYDNFVGYYVIKEK